MISVITAPKKMLLLELMKQLIDCSFPMVGVFTAPNNLLLSQLINNLTLDIALRCPVELSMTHIPDDRCDHRTKKDVVVRIDETTD